MHATQFGAWNSAQQSVKAAYQRFAACVRAVRSSELHGWHAGSVGEAFACADSLTTALHSLDPLQHDDIEAWLRDNSLSAHRQTTIAYLSQAHELLTKELLTSPFLRSQGSADALLQAWIVQLSRRGGEQATITLLTNILQEIQERKARLHGLATTLDRLDLPDRSGSDLFKQAVAFQLLASLCPSSESERTAQGAADPVVTHQDLVALCRTDDVTLDALCRAGTSSTIECLRTVARDPPLRAEDVAQAKATCCAILHHLLMEDAERILALDSAVWRSLCESHTDFAATAANVLMAMAEDSLATLSQPDAAEPRLRFLQQRLPAVIDALSAQLAQQRSSGGDPSWNDMKTMLGSLNNCFLAVQAAL